MDDLHASQVVASVRHLTFDNIQFDCVWSTPKRQHVVKTNSLNSIGVSDKGDTTTEGSHLLEEQSSTTLSVLRFSPDSRSLDLCPSSETNGSCGDSIVSELADSFATQSDFKSSDSPSKTYLRDATRAVACRRPSSNRAVRALSDDGDLVICASSSMETSHASPMSPLSPLSMAPTLSIPAGQHHVHTMTGLHPISYVPVSLAQRPAAAPITIVPPFSSAVLHNNRPMGVPVQVQLVPFPSPPGPWYFVPHDAR